MGQITRRDNQIDKIRYVPKISNKEIKENHKRFSERIALYKEKGLDFIASRKFILKKAHPLKGNILEIGTGSGYTTLSLAKAGYKFTTIDKDREALKTTALNLAYENILHNVIFYAMDGKSLTFANSGVESIIVVNLFHHVNGVDKMLLEIDRVLCANGKAVFADFNKTGMEIVNAVHKQEGRMHEDSGIGKDRIRSYFYGLGYEIKDYEEKCHWILIAKKKIQR